MANAATVGAKSMTVIMVARFCLWVASASFMIFVISKAYQLFKNINLEILIRTNEGNKKWWARLDLNQRPSGYEPPALTTELQALMESSGGGTRTHNLPVNSRMLCRLSYPRRAWKD